MKIKYINESENKITDEYIKSLFFTKNETINSNYLKPAWLNTHPEINDYLVNRYSDSTSYKETLYRILLGIEERPVCKTCGNPVSFEASHRWTRGRNGWPFLLYCSSKCQANDPDIKNKHIQTYKEKYGVDNPAKNIDVKEKTKRTNLERYGVENVYQSKEIQDRIKQTNIEKYGVDNPLKKREFIEKMQATNLKKYGSKTYGETQAYKDFYAEHKDEFQEKINSTKRQNKSFNISKKEDYLYDILKQEYPDIIRQYSSKEYNYVCDFYIPSLNLYIEYQGTWTHGQHPYNSDNEDDIVRKEYLEDKSQESKFYKNALVVWTVADPKKRNTAIENKLNYLEIYPTIKLSDVIDVINSNYNNETTNKQLVIGTK